MLKLAEDPYRKATIKVKGTDSIRRLRVGRYRVLYVVLEGKKEVLVVKVEKREESTYKRCELIEFFLRHKNSRSLVLFP